MTWKMDVRKDEPAPLGWHKAVCLRPEPVETAAFGTRLHWRYRLLESGIAVSGWTSMSPSTKARAYQWADRPQGRLGIGDGRKQALLGEGGGLQGLEGRDQDEGDGDCANRRRARGGGGLLGHQRLKDLYGRRVK